jgi:hypothetical protein
MRFLGALLVHFNLQMRPSGCNWEQVKSLKRRENRRAQTGQVGLAIRRLPVWMQEARRFASSLNSRAKIAASKAHPK